MKIKQIILFIFLTAILVIFAYIFLDIVDNHFSYLSLVVVGLVVIADIVAMTAVFFRYLKSSGSSHKQ